MTSFSGLLDGMDFRATRSKANPFLANPIEALTHWTCQLSRGTDILEFAISLQSESTPSAETAVSLLLADLATVHDGEVFEAWVGDLGIPVGDDQQEAFMAAYGAIKAHHEAAINSFGQIWVDSAVAFMVADHEVTMAPADVSQPPNPAI